MDMSKQGGLAFVNRSCGSPMEANSNSGGYRKMKIVQNRNEGLREYRGIHGSPFSISSLSESFLEQSCRDYLQLLEVIVWETEMNFFILFYFFTEMPA